MKSLKFTSALVLSGVLSISAMALETDQAVIYDTQCAKCHGEMAEGNPAKKGPALDNKEVGDLQVQIMDMQGELSFNGDGTSGDKPDMEHNLKVFEKRGIIIEPLEMARYIHGKFNKSTAKE